MWYIRTGAGPRKSERTMKGFSVSACAVFFTSAASFALFSFTPSPARVNASNRAACACLDGLNSDLNLVPVPGSCICLDRVDRWLKMDQNLVLTWLVADADKSMVDILVRTRLDNIVGVDLRAGDGVHGSRRKHRAHVRDAGAGDG
eukprot:SAG11_NODE_6025_length_1407_cov_1.059633_1_plen_145_part_10